MKSYTHAQALALFAEQIQQDQTDTDNDCQMIAYSGLYRWSDGTFRDEPQPCGHDRTGASLLPR